MRLMITALIGALFVSVPAHAEQVRFAGTIEVGCTLQVQDGTLAINNTYSSLSTENANGAPARVTVTTIGGTANLSFSAPQWSGSTPANALPAQIKFTSNRGKSQSYTDQAIDPISIGRSGDVLTLDARADNPFGFDAGTYEIVTIATCEG